MILLIDYIEAGTHLLAEQFQREKGWGITSSNSRSTAVNEVVERVLAATEGVFNGLHELGRYESCSQRHLSYDRNSSQYQEVGIRLIDILEKAYPKKSSQG